MDVGMMDVNIGLVAGILGGAILIVFWRQIATKLVELYWLITRGL